MNEQVGLGIHDPMTHCKPGRGKRPRARLVSLEARAGDQTSKQWRQSPARRSPAACNPFRLPRIADPHAQRPQCLRAVVVVFKARRAPLAAAGLVSEEERDVACHTAFRSDSLLQVAR